MVDRRMMLQMVGSTITALAASRLVAADASESNGETGQMSEGHVEVVGGRLKYTAAGEGSTLVLLHKLGGHLQEFRRVVPALAEHYRVISLDLAGHGQSQMRGEPPFIVTQETMAAQVMDALDSLQLPPPYRFIGSSLGGCTAIVCAALWPERVAAVACLGSALAGAASYEELRQAAAAAIASGQFDDAENPLPRPFQYAQQAFGTRDEAIAREQNESRREAGRWISPIQRGVGRIDYLALLPRVTAPVLLAWGKRGNYGVFVEPAVALLPNGRGQVVEDSGAFPHEEAPEATSKLLLAFLKQTSTAS